MTLSDTDWPAPPTLRGPSVILRPFTSDDAEVMADILADPEVIRLTGSAHSTRAISDGNIPIVDLRDWYGSRGDQRDRLDLAVVDRTTRAVVGEVVLNERDAGNHSCSFRTLMGAAGRDRGLGTEAIRMLLDYAFGHLGLHRIELEVYAFNPRARRAYEKVGFVSEGFKRDALLFDGERYDAEIMSILAPQWSA